MRAPLAIALLLVGGWVPATVALPATVPPAATHATEGDDEAFAEARALRRAGEPAAAAETLRAGLEDHLDDGDYLGLLGLCLLDAGAQGEARALLRERTAAAGESFRLAILRGRLLQLDDDLVGAEAAYREATRLNEGAVEAWVLWIRASMAGQRYGKALKNAERLEALQPELGRPLAAEILRLQGDGYRRLGASTIELAADKYLAALEKTPEDEALADLVLETQLNAVRLEAVAQLVEQRFSAEPYVRQRHYWTGRRLVEEQDADGARASFQAALAIDERDGDSALWLAKLALDDGQLDDARAWLERCSAEGLTTAQTELLMGEVLTELGELGAAETHLRAAAARDPDLSKALYLLGRLLMRTGQVEEAREVLSRFQDLTAPPPATDPLR